MSKLLGVSDTAKIPQITRESILENALADYHRIVLLGNPAVGKTTLLKYFAYSVLTRKDVTVLPIFLSLRNFDMALSKNDSLTLLQYIGQMFADMSFSGKFLTRELGSGSCLVLLDGLDEVLNRKSRIRISTRIDEFAAQFGQQNFIIVTSRPAGYWIASLSSGFEHFVVQPFDTSQIFHFIDRWTEMVERYEKGSLYDSLRVNNYRTELKGMLTSDPVTMELAKLPLFLAILCLINHQGIPIPKNKSRLYDYATQALVNLGSF